MRKVERRKREGLDFYRSTTSTIHKRTKKKLLKKVTWYREKRKRDGEDEKDLPELKRCRTGEEKKREKSKKDNPDKTQKILDSNN